MPDSATDRNRGFDRTNAIVAAVVFLVSFIVYAITVQRSFSFWDCGEFIASSYILGVPHPPGTPMYVLLGRVFSLVPFVEDISYRINYISVISSAFTAMFSYLLTVRIIRYFFREDQANPLHRLITYSGGIAGAFFVAFGATNWANSVEAEVYGMSLALSVAIVWLTLRHYEEKGTRQASRFMLLAVYLAMYGIGIHMTTFLVFPVCAIFFILRKEADWKDYLAICAFAILEVLMVFAFAEGRGGAPMFKMASVILGALLLIKIYRKVNWAILVAMATICTLIDSFSLFLYWGLPAGTLVLLILAVLSHKRGWQVQWKTALVILFIGIIGFSSHLYIPIRSSLNPRIDENNPSRDTRTFINYLDRKQYGQVVFVDRMFTRRGALSNQFGRHPHMGFWSYFEEQYSRGGWFFAPFFILGLIGMAVAIRKRLEIGMPFFTLVLLVSVGLVLYMNFADGTKYNYQTGDAYLEVRNRDYFFTPAFVFFGIAMGLGVAGVMQYLKDRSGRSAPGIQRPLVYASGLLVFLPVISLAHNYHKNDRSGNVIPSLYSRALLDTCEPNAILFTSGDNDTFPVWCLQEVYDYRKDVRVVNLSLLNTDWYIEQMKNRYGVPISLEDDQIVWYPFEGSGGVEYVRPHRKFHDRPRRRTTYLHPQFSRMKTQHIMMDDIVLENKWQSPIYFSSLPYAESPLKLREHIVHTGLLYKLERQVEGGQIDVDTGYDLYMNVYKFDGFEDSRVYRDDNATGVMLGAGMNSVRIYEELLARGDTLRADSLSNMLINRFAEFFQSYVSLADRYRRNGDSARAMELLKQAKDTLTSFVSSNKENTYYLQDLGMVNIEIGRVTNDKALIGEGIDQIWEAFDANSNDSYTFRKLIAVLSQQGRYTDLQRAARQIAEYKIHLNDPYVQRILGLNQPAYPAAQPSP